MSDYESTINFNNISPGEFEELCFELLIKLGFSSIAWRKGGGDSGRDIEAYFGVTNPVVGVYSDKYFFECKRHVKGVPPDKLASKIAWADAERPNHLVMLISSHLTNGARTWIEKIRRDKVYKIHVIEGDELRKLILPHDDLVKKYFIRNKHVELLNEIKRNWLIHGIVPSFSTYVYFLHNINLKHLPVEDIAYLFTAYYCNYSKLEELENRIYHGEGIDKELRLLESKLIERSTYSSSILVDLEDVDTLSDEGRLSEQFDDEDRKDYDFMATEMLINANDRQRYQLAQYVFKRVGATSAIEVLLFKKSNFETRIRYIKDYRFKDYKEAVKFLNFHNKRFESEVIANSRGMR